MFCKSQTQCPALKSPFSTFVNSARTKIYFKSSQLFWDITRPWNMWFIDKKYIFFLGCNCWRISLAVPEFIYLQVLYFCSYYQITHTRKLCFPRKLVANQEWCQRKLGGLCQITWSNWLGQLPGIEVPRRVHIWVVFHEPQCLKKTQNLYSSTPFHLQIKAMRP